MTPQQKNINIVHNCEEHLFNWLKHVLQEHGVSIDETSNLTEVLSIYENELDSLRQHLKPLQKWNKIKDECYNLSNKLNGQGEYDEQLYALSEKAAFEGQILWLTIRES
ncbi:MAG: hypothetical protein MI975_25050 [Cytophagales bacterium]|nr:hypothetical protein [Cytophagales bacterium]